jgi:hypothetical protein
MSRGDPDSPTLPPSIIPERYAPKNPYDSRNFNSEPPMTDPKFLEFWGNYLITVARGQKQLQDLTQWMRQSFQGWEDLTALFKKCYGLEGLEPDSPAHQDAWKKATADFRQSFRETFKAMGWVPEEDYSELAAENQLLRQKISEQDDIIHHLRMVLDEQGLDQGRTLEVFRDLIDKQGQEFQKLMKTLSESDREPDD